MEALFEIHFGAFRLDPANSCIWQGTTKHTMAPKDFTLLYALASRSGNLVTKTELKNMVWPKTAVSDNVIKTCIRRIRQILHDDYKLPQYIETIHRRGYRFICPIKTGKSPEILTACQSFLPDLVVGREKELHLLEKIFESVRSGARKTVFVSGEAGIGKTTLVNTFCRKAENRCTMLLIKGQCVENFGSGEPYRPILEALSDLCRTNDSALVLSKMKRCAPRWLLQMPWLLSDDEIAELQKLLIGTTYDQMLRELVEVLETVSNEIPLIIVVEDLHWSDGATLDALNAIARRQKPAQLLVVCTFRPEELTAKSHPLQELKNDLDLHGYSVDFPLSLLSTGDLAKLLARLYPDRTVPDRFIEWIYRNSEGNPLYVNALLNQAEILGWLKINKAAADELAAYETATSVLPGTLHHLIEKNLNRISKSEKIVVETASVVGRTFPVKLLADSAADQESVDAVCYRLSKRNQLLCSAGIMDWPDGTQTPCYSFIHSLHQQVTYNTIPPLRARRLHLEIGYRIEKAYQRDIGRNAANLATHFEQGRNYQKAVIYRQRAGEIAFERHAYQEVIDHINGGLGLLPKTSDKFDRGNIELSLQIMLGYTLVATQGYASPQVESTFSRAHELCSESRPIQKLMPVLFGLWLYYIAKPQFDEAWEVGNYYHRIASQAQNGAYNTWAYAIYCVNNWYQGRFTESAAYAEKSVASYDPIRHQPFVQQHGMDAGLVSWGHKAMTLCLIGYPDRAYEEGHKSLTISKKNSGPFMIATILTYNCAVHYFRRDVLILKRAVEELISLTNEHSIMYYHAIAEILRVWGLAVEGAAKDSLARISPIIEAYRATGANLMVNYFLYLLADIYRLDNQPELGLQVIDEALSITKTTDVRWIEGDLHRLKGDLYLMKSERSSKARAACLKKAEACFKEALEVSRRQKAILFELRAASGLSRVMDNQNNRDDALNLLKEVYGRFKEGFDLPDLKDTKLLIEALGRPPKSPVYIKNQFMDALKKG